MKKILITVILIITIFFSACDSNAEKARKIVEIGDPTKLKQALSYLILDEKFLSDLEGKVYLEEVQAKYLAYKKEIIGQRYKESKICYLRHGELFISDILNEKPKYIGYFNRCTNFIWSPDNKFIAYQNELEDDIYIIEIATNKIKRITNEDEFSLNPSWSADSQKIYYGLYNNIIEVDIASMKRKIMYEGSSGYIFYPFYYENNILLFLSDRRLHKYTFSTKSLNTLEFIPAENIPDYPGRDPNLNDNYFNIDPFVSNITLSHNKEKLLFSSTLVSLKNKSRTSIDNEVIIHASWAPDDMCVLYDKFDGRKNGMYVKDLSEDLPLDNMDIFILDKVTYCVWNHSTKEH